MRTTITCIATERLTGRRRWDKSEWLEAFTYGDAFPSNITDDIICDVAGRGGKPSALPEVLAPTMLTDNKVK